MSAIRTLRRWLRGLRSGPPVPPVRQMAERIPEPPLHDPTYHALANRLQVARGRAWQIDHAAYAAAEARSITSVPPPPDPDERRAWELTDEAEQERGRELRGNGGYLCESIAPW